MSASIHESEEPVSGMLRLLPEWADRGPYEREVRVLEIVYDTFIETKAWPQVAYVEATLFHRHGIELDEVFPGLPFGLMWPEPTSHPALQDQLSLETTLLGLTFVSDARADVELFLRVFRWSVDLWMQYTPPPSGPPEFRVPIRQFLDDMRRERRLIKSSDVARVLALARLEPAVPGWSGSQAQPDEATLTLGPALRDYRGVETLDDYFRRRPSYRRQPAAAQSDHLSLALVLRDILIGEPELTVQELAVRAAASEAEVSAVLDEYGVGEDGTVAHVGKGGGGGWVGPPHPRVQSGAVVDRSDGPPSESGAPARATPPDEAVSESEDATPAELGVPARAASDVAAPVDELGFAPLVNGLADLVSSPQTALPLAIAITGEWGAGKSSVMRQLHDVLELSSRGRAFSPSGDLLRSRRWLVATFDAWKHEGSERLWAALTKAIYDAALERERNAWERFWFKTSLECERQGRTIFFSKLLGPFVPLLAGLAYGIYALIESGVSRGGPVVLGGVILTALLSAVPRFGSLAQLLTHPFKRAIDQYTVRRRFEGALGFTREAERDVEALTRCATRKKRDSIAVFIDDLDRCRPTHVVEVVEAVNQIFNSTEHSNCLFVFGMDVDVIAASIRPPTPTVSGLSRRHGGMRSATTTSARSHNSSSLCRNPSPKLFAVFSIRSIGMRPSRRDSLLMNRPLRSLRRKYWPAHRRRSRKSPLSRMNSMPIRPSERRSHGELALPASAQIAKTYGMP